MSKEAEVLEVIVTSLPEGYAVDIVRRGEGGAILAATELMLASEFGMDKEAARKWARTYAQEYGYSFEPGDGVLSDA